MEKENARLFWNNVLKYLNGRTFKSVCESAGLNYLSIANRKSGKTPSLPRLESAVLLAKALGVSVESLFNEKEPISEDPRIIAIVKCLEREPEKLDAVEILLFNKKVGQSSMVG